MGGGGSGEEAAPGGGQPGWLSLGVGLLIWSPPFTAAFTPPRHISSLAVLSDLAAARAPHKAARGLLCLAGAASPRERGRMSWGCPTPQDQHQAGASKSAPTLSDCGKGPSALKEAPFQHLKSSFLANKMFIFKIIIIKKRIPASGHSVKWLQAHSSMCPLPSPGPNPATSPALYSRRVTDRP